MSNNSRPLVTVIIPNWNGKRMLDTCLGSLMGQSFKRFAVIVVDNGSTDDSVDLVVEKYPKVKLIKNKYNVGFARAVNQGIIVSKSMFVVLLNNDTRVDKDYLKSLVESLRSKSGICGIAPKVLNFINPDILDSAGDVMNDVGQAFHRGNGDKAFNWNRGDEVFLITAGSSIYKREAFNKVGLFDEAFFAYGEDVDWCLRAQLLGCRFWYEPRAIVYHHHKGTSKRIPRKTEYLQFRNMTMTIIKNIPFSLFLKKWRFITIPLVHVNTFMYLITRGLLREALLADLAVLASLPRLIKKRCQIMSKRKKGAEYFARWMEQKKIRYWRLPR